MKIKLLISIFFLSALLAVGATYFDDGLIIYLSGVAFVLTGATVAARIARKGYIYCSTFLGFHVVIAGFTDWVYINQDFVVHEKEFVFSVFTGSNLQWAFISLNGACLVIVLTWMLLGRGRYVAWGNFSSMLGHVIVRLASIPIIWFYLSLVFSILLTVFIFITNPSVINIPYPVQLQMQWVPWEFLKIPVILAVFAITFAYARSFIGRPGSLILLQVARVSFLIITVLMLLLMGARGFVTFLWLGIGLLEFWFFKKNRGSLKWSILFVILAWIVFQSGPYIRWSLSQLPIYDVVIEATKISLLLGDVGDDTYSSTSEIRLNDFTMIGASLFQLLYVIQLINDGISLGGATFVNLIPQAIPSWLDGVILQRPASDGWILGDYFYHGGGFIIFANAYWNGGLAVGLVFICVLTAIFVGLDRYAMRRDAGLLYRAVYWLWLPVMILQLGYGLQGMVRVLQLLWAVMLLEHYLVRRRRGNCTSFSSQPTSQVTTNSYKMGTRKL